MENMINIDREPAELYPALFTVFLEAGMPPHTDLHNYHCQVVSYTPREATEKALEHMRKENADIHELGTHAGGWKVRHVASMSIEELEEKFKTVAAGRRADIRKNLGDTKNRLMNKIIVDRDLDLLYKNTKYFTEAEQLYIHDKITKTNYENKN